MTAQGFDKPKAKEQAVINILVWTNDDEELRPVMADRLNRLRTKSAGSQ